MASALCRKLAQVGLLPLLLIINFAECLAQTRIDCKSNEYPGPTNPNFETGTLDGWQVVSGDAFGNSSVSSTSSYWDGPFHQNAKYFILGTAQSGEQTTGQLRSGSFKASSVMGFLISGGYDPDNLYVALVRDKDNEVLLKQTALNDEAFVRIIWDTRKWAGQMVYVLIYDGSTSASWGHINFDDLRVGCPALGDGDDLNFNVIGQASQPPARSSGDCSLYSADPLRPQYHYTPYQGWINDPAGLIQWKGKHQLFSQYNPVAPQWGPMHWAHAESTDAVHWRQLPVALSPNKTESPQDTSGRFTGSAVADPLNHDRLTLVFTDFTDLSFHPDAVREVVSLATTTDGVSFPLYPKNPLVARPPSGFGPTFRDPKVFRDPSDGMWKMVLSSGRDGKGIVFIFQSDDLTSWSYLGLLYTGDGSTGDSFECPNFFPLGDKWVLIYGGNGLGWWETGSFNGSVFTSEKRGLFDHGPASYATQWYKDSKGRNLAIAWMGNWNTPKWASRLNGWAGQQSVTRELFLTEDSSLGSRPVVELDSLNNGRVKELGPKKINGNGFTIASSNTARIKVTLNLAQTTADSFTLNLAQSKAETAALIYEVASGKLTLDTTRAGYAQSGKWSATIPKPKDGKLALDVFIDRSSVEVFSSDGTVISALVWPVYKESNTIQLVAQDGVAAVEQLSFVRLGSSWC